MIEQVIEELVVAFSFVNEVIPEIQEISIKLPNEVIIVVK